jgi:ABC-2 type transport system ATP-binding protein
MTNPVDDGPVAAIHDLTVRYGRVTAVDRISLAIRRGAVYALLGRNGSGKSSTVHCLVGQLKPAAGQTVLFGQDAWRERASLMNRVGLVPESPDIPPDMTAEQAAAFFRALHTTWDETIFTDRMARFKVPRQTRFRSLSKGQKRQLSLALVLATSPELLILDDPTLGLDVVARRQLYEEIITDLAERGTTVLVTTHDIAGVEGIADRVGILRDGRLVLDEELESIKGRFRRLLFSPADTSDAPPVDPVLEPVGRARRRVVGDDLEVVIAAFEEDAVQSFAAHPGISDVRAESVSLEDIVVTLCGEEEGGQP